MSLYDLSPSRVSMLPYKDQEEAYINSFCHNHHEFLSQIFPVNKDDFNFDKTNDISQGILTMKEKEEQNIYKWVFDAEFYFRNIGEISDDWISIDNIEENVKNSLEDNSMNKIDNQNIIIEIKNTNFNFEQNGNQKNIFNIFNNGDYDSYSNIIIEEASNDANKKHKKIKKNKKIFTQIPKKPKKPKEKNIEHRKDNADNIRKKIKVKFHKFLKNAINEKLKKAGSKFLFKALSQDFITNITKEKNKQILDLPLKKIFSLNFSDKENKNKEFNLKVLEYLDKNHNISEKSNFNKIKNMKYEQAFNEYLLSKEFKIAISTLKKDNENDKYIKNYIIKAHNFINFFKHDKKKKKNSISSN